jgi:CRP-like cAMP-binding protein
LESLSEKKQQPFFLCSDETHPGGDSLFQELPQTVQEDVCMKGYGAMFTKVPILAQAEPSFLRQLSVRVALYLHSPGDMIIYKGDLGMDLFIIRKGFVEVLKWEGREGEIMREGVRRRWRDYKGRGRD